MKNIIEKIIKNEELKRCLIITGLLILIIMIAAFTKFNQVPFVYNEF